MLNKEISVEPIEDYVNAREKILHRCKICNNEWYATPTNILKGRGCPNCYKTNIGTFSTKSTNKYIKQLHNKFKGIILLEEYVNGSTEILHKCLICNTVWKAKPTYMLQNKHGCQVCDKNSKLKSHEKYIEELRKINPNIIPLEKYRNSSTKILHKCLVDNYIWSVIPDSLLRGHGCPKCAHKKSNDNLNKISKSNDQYICEVAIKNSNITPVENYISCKTKILHRCNICNHEWYVSPSNVLKGRNCPLCSRNIRSIEIRKTHADYIKDLEMINKNIKPIEDYVNARTPILHKCKIDGYEWFVRPNATLRGNGCPRCKAKENSIRFSKGSKQYKQELKNICSDIDVIGNYINAFTPILHHCKIHNVKWYEKPTNILNGSRCPECLILHSKGEVLIKLYLDKNSLNYSIHHCYNDLRGIKNGLLSYDFYLIKYNILIEFQGIQHEHSVEHFGGQKQFIIQQIHDIRKRKYAKKHNIKLITIWYNQINKISQILDKCLNNLKSESLTTAG